MITAQATGSDRTVALVIIWNRVIDAWTRGDFDEAKVIEGLYTLVENMTDWEFVRGYDVV